MALITANEAAKATAKYYADQKKKWYEAMQSFAENELANLINSEANRGCSRAVFKLPECVVFDTLNEYLVERGYTLEKSGTNQRQCTVSWQVEPLPQAKI